MARLPKPGSDQGKWGEILNDYLSQSHKADGTLKDNTVGTNQLQTNSITTSQLQDSSITTLKLADNATTTDKLANGAVTTPKLTDNSVTTTKLTDNSVTTAKLAGVGQPNGIATLDTNSKLNESQVPDRLTETAITNEITERVTPLVEQAADSATAAASSATAAETARTGAETARNQTEAAVTSGLSWTGTVDLTTTALTPVLLRATLTGNVTITLPTPPSNRAYTVTLVLVQDATGGRSITLPGVKWSYGVPAVLSTAPGTVDILHLLWTGTAWVGMIAGMAIA